MPDEEAPDWEGLRDYFDLEGYDCNVGDGRLFKALSAFHKYIRRCNKAEAELVALALYLKSPEMCWREILNASTEETSSRVTIVAVDTLYRQHEEMATAAGAKDIGVLARLAMIAAGLIANAPKDRIADEMLHLTDFCDLLTTKYDDKRREMDKWYRDLGIGKQIDRLLVEKVASPELMDKFNEVINRDFVLDKHTGRGASRPLGRKKNTCTGEAFWDGPATYCENRTPSYIEWREKVYDEIRGWALESLRKATRQQEDKNGGP